MVEIWLRGHPRSLKMASFDRSCTNSYKSDITSIFYLVLFSRYLTLKNIVTSISRLGVIHPVNLCTICASLKSTDPELSCCPQSVGLSLITAT